MRDISYPLKYVLKSHLCMHILILLDSNRKHDDDPAPCTG